MEQTVETRKKANKVMPFVLGIIVVVGSIIGIYAYHQSQKYTSTDNAQIDANINPVVSRVSGYVKSIRFTDNQYVKTGDTLVFLEDNDYRLKLEQAEATLEAARLNTSISQENIVSAQTSVLPAESNLKTARIRLWKATEDFNRYSMLMQNQATSPEKFDAVKAEKESAEAQMATVQNQLTGAKELVKIAEKQESASAIKIKQCEVDVDAAKLQLSYTIITAPASGVVSKRNIQIGQLVQAGSPLFTVVNTDSMFVTANFKETQMDGLRIGQQADIEVDAFPDDPLTGTVVSFSGATGARFSLLPPDNATGNFVKVVQRIPVRINLTNLKKVKDLIRPGMSVDVKIHTK